MVTIEAYMNITNPIIQYVIVFVIALLLIGFHNWLLSSDKPNPFKRSTINLTSKEKVAYWMVLFFGTLLLMFGIAIKWIAPFPQLIKLDGVIAIGVASILSFFIIFTFNGLLATMRQNKLSLKFLVDQNFMLTAYFIILIALSFLNWVKEIETYAQKPFLVFVICYTVLIAVIGIFLDIPKQNGSGKTRPDYWRFKTVILLDPIIIGLLIGTLVKVILDIILLIQWDNQ
jgi:glucan phosphoethanolaminetransferase (alkaline phosphatase superfamily)